MSKAMKYQLGKSVWQYDGKLYTWYSAEGNKKTMRLNELIEAGATPLPDSKEEEIEEISTEYIVPNSVEDTERRKINELIKAVNQHSKVITELQKGLK